VTAGLADFAEKIRRRPGPKTRAHLPKVSIHHLVGATPEQWASLAWRLDHLYQIVDKKGKLVKFVMNRAQRDFIDNMHTRNIILKARQLGFSTLMQILELDTAMFNAHANCVVIADTLPNAGRLFGKVELGFKTLPKEIRAAFPVKSAASKSLIEFENGSSVSVSTSSRGGTVKLLHVSELGKISRKYPERANEIVTGAFESVPIDPDDDAKSGISVVESTAEGAFGEFWDITEPAIKRWESGEDETALDWRLHFYPWFDDPDYRLSPDDTDLVSINDKDRKYFESLEASLGITIDAYQRAWYVKKRETLGRKMKQEYPSTPYEAFEQAVEGAVFGEEMTRIREAGRLLDVIPVDPTLPVNTFWDLGINDATAIWFHQRVGLMNHWVKYVEGSGKDLNHWWNKVCVPWAAENNVHWGKHYLPHDADKEIQTDIIETASKILDRLGMKMSSQEIVTRIPDKSISIELMREKLPAASLFDKVQCADGIKALDAYQFEWDEKRGMWKNDPLHNWASNGVDAMMQWAQGYSPVATATREQIKRFTKRKATWR
jgi:hypothetical protein